MITLEVVGAVMVITATPNVWLAKPGLLTSGLRREITVLASVPPVVLIVTEIMSDADGRWTFISAAGLPTTLARLLIKDATSKDDTFAALLREKDTS